MTNFRNTLTASVLLAAVITTATAHAQPYMSGSGMMGPGMMRPGMMGPFGGPMCGMSPGRIMFGQDDKLIETLKLTDAQRAKYEDFKAASRAASESMRNSCDANTGSSVPNRMEGMESRMTAMLAAMRVIRPALESFYESLTDAQKAQLDSSAGGSRHPHWRGKW